MSGCLANADDNKHRRDQLFTTTNVSGTKCAEEALPPEHSMGAESPAQEAKPPKHLKMRSREATEPVSAADEAAGEAGAARGATTLSFEDLHAACALACHRACYRSNAQ